MDLNVEEDVRDSVANYYELFKLPVEYDINKSALEDAYIEAMTAWSNEDEQDLGDCDSSYINRAYKTLKDPIARGEYFLRLCGENPDKMCGSSASEMFDMETKYYSLLTDLEREDFQTALSQRKDKLLQDLEKIEDKEKFIEIFVRAQFLDSFLKKVRPDVYNRD